jgi:hypothetical protein
MDFGKPELRFDILFAGSLSLLGSSLAQESTGLPIEMTEEQGYRLYFWLGKLMMTPRSI